MIKQKDLDHQDLDEITTLRHQLHTTALNTTTSEYSFEWERKLEKIVEEIRKISKILKIKTPLLPYEYLYCDQDNCSVICCPKCDAAQHAYILSIYDIYNSRIEEWLGLVDDAMDWSGEDAVTPTGIGRMAWAERQ